MKKLWRSQQGITLAELLVGLGILSLIMSTIGAGLFQALGTQAEVRGDGHAIDELRKGFGWIAQDVKMANSTDLVDGAPAVSSVTLTSTDNYDGAEVSHTVSYALVVDRLVRTYDGTDHTVGRRVVSVSFSRSGNTVTAQFEVDVVVGTTRTLSLKTVMRSTSS